MPIYEYRCNNCRRRTTIFARSFSPSPPVCGSCGSDDVVRLISRFAVLRSEESLLEDLADPARFGDVDESDPRSMARWARKMGQEMGEELGPDFDEMVARMEAGEMPEELMGEEGEPDEFD